MTKGSLLIQVSSLSFELKFIPFLVLRIPNHLSSILPQLYLTPEIKMHCNSLMLLIYLVHLFVWAQSIKMSNSDLIVCMSFYMHVLRRVNTQMSFYPELNPKSSVMFFPAVLVPYTQFQHNSCSLQFTLCFLKCPFIIFSYNKNSSAFKNNFINNLPCRTHNVRNYYASYLPS